MKHLCNLGNDIFNDYGYFLTCLNIWRARAVPNSKKIKFLILFWDILGLFIKDSFFFWLGNFFLAFENAIAIDWAWGFPSFRCLLISFEIKSRTFLGSLVIVFVVILGLVELLVEPKLPKNPFLCLSDLNTIFIYQLQMDI